MSTKKLEKMILEKQREVRAIIASWSKQREDYGTEDAESGSEGDDTSKRPSSG